jgi:hypothetical protein
MTDGCDAAGMTSVLPVHGSPSTPAVVRTFAEARVVQQERRHFRKVSRVVPAGLVHAAGDDPERALCGVLLSALHEFGRSRYPFERFRDQDRCRQCDESAGRPRA